MKKSYVRPVMQCEEFAANEYVAACYKIKCTTPNNNSIYNYVYNDTNGNGEYDRSDDKEVHSSFLGFSGCNRWHKGVILDEAPVANGFVVDYWGNVEEVFWWKEELGTTVDVHVMVPGAEAYETNPNAS